MKIRAPKLQFGLRFLLVVMALVAVGSYYAGRPSVLATEFTSKLRNGELGAANMLLVKRDLAKWNGLESFAKPNIWQSANIRVEELTLRQLLHGERNIYVTLESWDLDSPDIIGFRVTQNGVEYGIMIY